MLIVVVRAVVEKLRVDLHEELHGIIHHAVDRPWTRVSNGHETDIINLPVPMSFRVLVQRCKHDRQDRFNVVTNKVAEVLVVPEVQRSFGNLLQVSMKIFSNSQRLDLLGNAGSRLIWPVG